MALSPGKLSLRTIVAVLATALLLDLVLGMSMLRDGSFRGRPLPPFDAVTHPRQRAWVERQRALLATSTPTEEGAGAFDAELGWTLRPDHFDPDGVAGTNSSAARGRREYAATEPDGTLRVVTFGDSFTYGDGVAESDTWQARMEAVDPGLEVPNHGVPGYGTDQALLRFRRKGLGDASVAVMGILLENIGRNVNRYRPLWYPRSAASGVKPRLRLVEGSLLVVPQPFDGVEELLDAVEDGSVLERLAEHEYWRPRALGPLRHSSLARLAAGYFAYRRRDVRRLWTTAGEPRDVTLALLETFAREARAAGAEVAAVIVFPRQDDLLELQREGRPYWAVLHRFLEERGIPYLDASDVLLPALQTEARAPDAAKVYAGGHLSAHGNALVGDRAAAWVRDLQPASADRAR